MISTLSKLFTELFFVSMYWRIFYGFIRIIFGIALLKVVGAPLLDVLADFLSHEFLEGPSDILFMMITKLLADHHFSVTYFLSGYFIFWGAIDVLLSYNLIREKLWAFPVSLGLIGLFILYGIFRFTFTHSLVLLSVITLDIIIFFLIYKEYKKVKSVS